MENIYFNLEKDEEIRSIFEKTMNEEKIIEEIELYLGLKIDLEKTLFFLMKCRRAKIS